MLTTKRYDYVLFEQINIHPCISNHRGLNDRKVSHYADDILKNGLLEPLIVWERKAGEFFLVGGFHRLNAIRRIREKNAGYFDRIDVRVVDGELDEMQALNLKLNADRLDAKISDYFDAVIFMNNANWSKERIADFLDKTIPWIEDIIHFAPGMDSRLRKMLDEGKLSWNRVKAVCRKVLEADPGKEREVVEDAVAEIEAGPQPAPRRLLSIRKAASTVSKLIEKSPKTRYSISGEDLLSLLLVLQGKNYEETHVERVRKVFPGLVE
ncbi:MAG TPA: chromosome partitioning protein ParB [Verrucomicrobia bacterium]|nr:MAG: chromosome partitioning protein ParB [Lentisphaerae bacterium GWF2_57_35]HBA85201.1 chromosome partitioning protein ParB [Verrucomicrobiota bacterium]